MPENLLGSDNHQQTPENDISASADIVLLLDDPHDKWEIYVFLGPRHLNLVVPVKAECNDPHDSWLLGS